jgi:hypothetical protein
MKAFLPRYFIGRWQDHLDLATNAVLDQNGEPIRTGEYHGWTPDDPPTADSVLFVVMRDSAGDPHPHWREFPHPLDQKLLTAHFAPPSGQPERRANVAAAMAQTAVPVTSGDTTFSFAMKIHAKMPVFRP